ncbi:hypothetical protein [Deinococcus petrolearius]
MVGQVVRVIGNLAQADAVEALTGNSVEGAEGLSRFKVDFTGRINQP